MARKKKEAPAPEPTSPVLSERLFHGTSRPFKVGDVILPRAQTGVPPNPGEFPLGEGVAAATPDVNMARAYARGAVDWTQRFAQHGIVEDASEAKPYVYEVQPVNPEEGQWVERKSRSGVFKEHVSPSGYQVVRNAWRMK